MGWTYSREWKLQDDVVAECTRGWDNADSIGTVLKRKICREGDMSVLWTVHQVTQKQTRETHRFIGCFLLERCRGDWGYKDMSEAMGPSFYSCPLAYLKLAPEADATWRRRVHAFHARQNFVPEVGKSYDLVAGYSVTRVTICNLKPLQGRTPEGQLYRLKPNMLVTGLTEPHTILYPDEAAKQALLDTGQAVRCAAVDADNGQVHVLFQRADKRTIGFYMAHATYDAIPLGKPVTPDDYRKFGALTPAPDDFAGRTTKQVAPAELLTGAIQSELQLQAA